jgi:hypothetical protein
VADARDPKDVRRIEELEAYLAKAHREIAELKRIVAELLERERRGSGRRGRSRGQRERRTRRRLGVRLAMRTRGRADRTTSMSPSKRV